MAKEDVPDELNVTREQMIHLLNEDLAREYQAIIAYTVYSQVLKGAEYMDIAQQLEIHAAQELSHALKISKQIDYLGGMPGVVPKAVKTSDDPVEMLRADLENERETVAQYRQRIRQAEAMGEFALSEALREIIVQEQDHEIDLCDALGINVPIPKKTTDRKFAEVAHARDHSAALNSFLLGMLVLPFLFCAHTIVTKINHKPGFRSVRQIIRIAVHKSLEAGLDVFF